MVIRFRTKANAKGVLCRPFTERRWLRDFNTRDHGGTNLSSGPTQPLPPIVRMRRRTGPSAFRGATLMVIKS